MADQYGRDTSPLAGAGGGSPYGVAGEQDYQQRAGAPGMDPRTAAQIEAMARQYPEMGNDIMMMMQGAQNDISGASLDGDLGGPGQPGLEAMLQQAVERAMQPEEQPNMFQRILQTASVMPGLTGDPAGAGILSLLMGVTDTPLGSRAGARGLELSGIGRILSAYAQLGKLGVQRQQAATDQSALSTFQANEAQQPDSLKFGAHHLSPGVSYTNPRLGITVKAPDFSPEQNFAIETERRTLAQNRSRGTAGAPAGGGVGGTGPSPVYDADALGRARATGQPLPQPLAVEPGEPVEAMRRVNAMAAGIEEDKAAARSYGMEKGKGRAQVQGSQALPPAQTQRLQDIDQAQILLDQLEEMYLGRGDKGPQVPGFEADPNDPMAGGKVIIQGLDNARRYMSSDPNIEGPEKLRMGLATLIARGYGEKGNVSDADVKRALGLIPSMWEGLGTRRQKIAHLREIQNRVRESVLALQGRIPGVKGGGYSQPAGRRGTIEEVKP